MVKVSIWSILVYIVWFFFGYIVNFVILIGMRLVEIVIRELSVNSYRGYFIEVFGEFSGMVVGIVF